MTPSEIYKRKKPVWRDGLVVGWQNSVGYSDGSETNTFYTKRQ